jgi:hypothetical protein
METTYVLWAVKIGDADWEEQNIVDTTDPARLEKAKQWATANGFDRLRVMTHTDGDMPDFTKAVK